VRSGARAQPGRRAGQGAAPNPADAINGAEAERADPGEVTHLKPQLDHPDSPPPGGVTQCA
jgi:hypothetical protein